MNHKISYAQNAEDIFLERIFEEKNDGFYIDLGAAHPLHDSVTALLYAKGWKGINVEPDRRFIDLLVESRPRDLNLNFCVSTNQGFKTLHTADVLGWSTTVKDVAERFVAEKSDSYEVPTKTLESIFELTENEIHLLKIDCEGSELDILKSSPFNKKRPWVIVVEIIEPHSNHSIDGEVRRYLEAKNYDMVYFDGLNGFFIDKDKIGNFNSKNFRPVSVFDGYITFREKLTTEQLNQTTEQLNQTTERLNQTTEQLNQSSEYSISLGGELKKIQYLNQAIEQEAIQQKLEIHRMTHSLSWLLTRPLRFVKAKLLKLINFNVPTKILEINNSKFFRTYILVILKRVKPLRKLSKRLLAKARIQKTIESNSLDYEKMYFRSAPQVWQKFDSEKMLLPNAEITCKKPLLSICVSTFNRAHWLQHSIPHLLESTKKYGTLIEVLVVDNASSDDSLKLLNELKLNYNFNLIINPINVGMLGNLAVTANAASGEFTWILGDDDFIDPDAIESILKIIWNHPAINMIYANYSHINFEPDEFRDYLDLRKNSVLIEPDSASFYVERILEMSSKTENFFTAIYCCIFRSDHARKCFEIYDESKPFESLEGCVPTTKYVLDNLLQEPGYWFGKNLITVNTNVSWLRYADLWVLDRFPEIYNRFESAGVPRNEVDKYRKRSIDGVKFHLEDSINKNSTNLINLQLHHLITGYRHLSDFKKNDDFFRTLLKRNTRLEGIYLNAIGASDVQIPGILVEGPFIGSYSLARVNRGVTKALSKSGKNVYISPSPTEGLNFEIPDEFHDEDISRAYFNPSKDKMTEILIRDTFPPTVEKMYKNLNLYHSFGWEESEFPLQYIEDFNKNLDGITVMSSYVKKVLVDNGVRVPISVTGLGIDYIANVPIGNFAKRNFRFLSVSSAFPRKGIDILLRAFVEEFKSDEDVELVLKTFPNIHNDLEIQITQIQENGARTPMITLINEDWESDLEVAKLYKSADVVVAPSRGEGFGWAIGEALAYHIPVIATGFGGHLDIIDHSYPWIVDFEFQYSNSHFDQSNSIWVEPNLDHLKKLMRSAFETPKSVRDALGEKYGERALKSNNWEEVSLRIEKFIAVCIKNASQSESHTGKTAILTTWEEQCGISEYSHELLKSEEFSETLVLSRISSPNSASRDQVIQCWKQGEVEEVLELLRKREIKNLIVQYQPSFFSLFELSKIVSESLNHEINLFIILHNVKDFCEKMSRDLHPIFANRNVNFLVHTAADLNQIKKLKPELLQRTIHFPHPNYFIDSELIEVKQKANRNITISSFGFLHENKGTDLLINIFGEVKKKYPGAKLNLVNAHLDERSTIFKKKCMKLIEEMGLTDSVSWTTEFLSFLEIQRVLSKSDLIILPYRETTESSSGAVRVCMTSQVPVLVSESSIFSDVANVVQRSSVHNIPEFSRRVFQILENPDLQLKMVEAQRSFLSSYSFEKMSRKLYNIIKAQSQFSRSADIL